MRLSELQLDHDEGVELGWAAHADDHTLAKATILFSFLASFMTTYVQTLLHKQQYTVTDYWVSFCRCARSIIHSYWYDIRIWAAKRNSGSQCGRIVRLQRISLSLSNGEQQASVTRRSSHLFTCHQLFQDPARVKSSNSYVSYTMASFV